MKHIPAHKIASLSAGTWRGKAAARARTHVKSCSECTKALGRIESGRKTMREIAVQESPELGWDHIATRIYWSTSSERRANERAHPKSRWPIWQRSLLAGGALGSLVLLSISIANWGGDNSSTSQTSARVSEPTSDKQDFVSAATQPFEPSILPPKSAPDALRGIVTFASGRIQLGNSALNFDSLVLAGNRFTTGDGELVIQFGLHNAFRLAPHSELLLRSFDSENVVLEVSGLVDIDIAKRLPGQRFVVIAGEQEVVVHGTAFRVDFRDADLDVSCTRGKVVVTDGDAKVHVPAGQGFAVANRQWNNVALRVLPLSAKRSALIDSKMQMPLLASWDAADPLQLGTSAVLSVEASGDREVALDGIALASGNFLVRTNGGRHQIATVASDGSLAEGEWIEASAGRVVRAKVGKRSVGSSEIRKSRSLRKRELRSALNAHGKSDRCMARLRKQGLLAGAYVEFEVGINSDGSQRYLNISDSNLSPVIQRCLRSAVDAEVLKAGLPTEFSIRLDF